MTTHYIEPERETLHGSFSRDAVPIRTIESGDTVIYRTLDAGWNLGAVWAGYPEDVERKFAPRDSATDSGHAMCGPIEIAGAEPGMTLEVRIGAITPGNWGWTSAGGWKHDVHERLQMLDREGWLRWNLDPAAMTARNQFGHEVSLRPFMGVMGMPTNEPGILSTAPPRRTGGNLDCKELVAGTQLFLPIEVPGALFSVGDGHALQGDGEVCVTAIECPMERVELTFILHKDLKLQSPRALTDEGWLALGLHADLQEATYLAIEDILDLMTEQYVIDRHEAFALASLVVDLRITQIVNGVRGVHAVLPHNAVRGLAPRT